MCRVLALAMAVCALAQAPADEFRTRRAAMRESLGDSVLVLFSHTSKDLEELRSGFLQEPNFYYLTGWQEPGAILLLTPKTETLFLPVRNPAAERYTGRKLSSEDPSARADTGFEQVLPAGRFESELRTALESWSRIQTLVRKPYAQRLRELAPLREVADAAPALERRRARKSAAEIERIERATEVSQAAHRTAWKRIAPGNWEYQVAASFAFTVLEAGCERPAYAPVVGSGPNSIVLHYSRNSRRMEAGDLLLIDAGAECSAYASDITRTLPVGGRFTPRQREIYELVLGAQAAAIAAVKPGATMGEINRAARDYIDSKGKAVDGKKLSEYMLHRISHGVGLEVHDPPGAGMPEPLEAGMVITIEPGLYLSEENIGVRIEDVVLVTKDGARVLSARLPRREAEIEEALRP
jgi:Xaa-Pro aminopeptidase